MLARSDSGVVALAGANVEALAADPDLHQVVILRAVVAPRVVTQRVLVAGLFGHAGVEFLKRVALHRVVHVAAGVVRIGLQAREFAFEVAAAHADAVDRDVIAKQLFHRIVVGVSVGFAIVAIGDQEDDLAAVAAAVFQQLRRLINGVVQSFGGSRAENDRAAGSRRCARTGYRLPVDGRTAREYAARGGRGRRSPAIVDARAAQFGQQLVLVVRESFAGVKVGVKAADERFVVDAQTGDDGREARFHLPGILGFEVIVEQNDGGERKRLGGKILQALLHVVV